jgi:hypothetical protein
MVYVRFLAVTAAPADRTRGVLAREGFVYDHLRWRCCIAQIRKVMALHDADAHRGEISRRDGVHQRAVRGVVGTRAAFEHKRR